MLATCALDTPSACSRVHVLDLPAHFNTALLHFAEKQWGWGVLEHGPYGAPLPPPLPVGWHNTSDLALEPLLHRRAAMWHEPNPQAAAVVFAPYYAGLALRLLGSAAAAVLEQELLERLGNSTAWTGAAPGRRLLALSVVANEFAQQDWGSRLLLRPELAGVVVATIEARPGCNLVGAIGGNYGGRQIPSMPSRRACWGEEGVLQTAATLVGVPYPPRSWHREPALSLARELRCGDGADGSGEDEGIVGGEARRPKLAAYIGSTLHSQVTFYPLRHALAIQCDADGARCAGGEFASAERLLAVYAEADFCVQPPGDTATRRGIFDALSAGCVPVLLFREQLLGQYPHHLPADPFDDDAGGGAALLLPEEKRDGFLDFLAAVPPARLATLRANGAAAAASFRYDLEPRAAGTPRDDGTPPDALEVLLRGICATSSGCAASESEPST